MRFGFAPGVVEIVSCVFGIGIATSQMQKSCVLSLRGLTFFCYSRVYDRFATCRRKEVIVSRSCSYLWQPFAEKAGGLTFGRGCG